MAYKIAVLGLGSIGTRHRDNILALGHQATSYDPTIHTPSWRDDIIDRSDAVVIASPTDQHFNDIMACNAAGKPMFVEKPIVSTYGEWANVPCDLIQMVGYNLRFHSCVKRAKELMGTGAIGKPLWARFICGQYNDKPAYLRDGVVKNWSHEIDLATYLLGSADLSAAAVDGTIADICLVHRRTGARTVVHLDYVTKPERRGFLIVGENGSIEADLVRRQMIQMDTKGYVVDRFLGRDTFDGNYLEEMNCFIGSLDNPGDIPYPAATAADAILTMKICLEALGQWPLNQK